MRKIFFLCLSLLVAQQHAVGDASELVALPRVGNYVWFDTNADGIQEAGEPPVVGVTVSLIDVAVNSVVATTQTDGNGLYQFGGGEDVLSAGKAYVLSLNNPLNFIGQGALVGYALTSANAGSNDALDSDAGLRNGSPAIEVIAPAAGDDFNSDFGFVHATPGTETPGLTPRIINLSAIQTQMDGNAAGLLHETLQAVNVRRNAAAKGACKALGAKAAAKIKKEAQVRYLNARTIALTQLPTVVVSVDDVSISPLCSTAQSTSRIQSFIGELNALSDLATGALNDCKSSVTNRGARNAYARVVTRRNSISKTLIEANASAASYPQRYGVCK